MQIDEKLTMVYLIYDLINIIEFFYWKNKFYIVVKYKNYFEIIEK